MSRERESREMGLLEIAAVVAEIDKRTPIEVGDELSDLLFQLAELMQRIILVDEARQKSEHQTVFIDRKEDLHIVTDIIRARMAGS